MRKRLLTTLLAAAVLCSCEDDNISRDASIGFELGCPSGVEKADIHNIKITLRDITTGQTYTYESTEGISVAKGMYECTVTAYVTIDGTEYELTGRKNIEVSDEVTFGINLYMSSASNDFIFEEIFVSGTRQEGGKNYSSDKYFKIYNNTDHVLYADGLALLESKFNSKDMRDCTPNIMDTHFAIKAMYVIPGNGKEHPVEPGGTITLCDIGIDHRATNPNSFDLSKADFEWYDVSQVASQQDIDSEVENLDKWVCDTKSIYLPNAQCTYTYALARVATTVEAFVIDNVYEYTYPLVSTIGTTIMNGTSTWKVPNEWIVDAVSFGYENSFQWQVISEQHEHGYVQMGEYYQDASRYFRSARRKMLSINEDGRRVLKDTNNSTDDFNANVIPSLIEEQQTAIDTEGTKASTKTYDGVTPIK